MAPNESIAIKIGPGEVIPEPSLFDLLETLKDVKSSIQDIKRNVDFFFHPQPIKIYKPSHKDLSGSALSLELRLDPVYEGGYIKEVKGGLFATLVPQKTMKKGDEDATFAWPKKKELEDGPPNFIISKLGLPDITAWLYAFECRASKKLIPVYLRPKGDEIGATISLFHKFENDDSVSTTAITYTLDKESGHLKMSKSATLKRSISISLSEELQIKNYLQHALTAFQMVGKR